VKLSEIIKRYVDLISEYGDLDCLESGPMSFDYMGKQHITVDNIDNSIHENIKNSGEHFIFEIN